MTPHSVIALLTQDQTEDLMAACAQFLSVERIMKAMVAGLEPAELKELKAKLDDHLCVDEEGDG